MEEKGFMPKRDMADHMIIMEKWSWQDDLEGKTFKSLEELKKECPEAEKLESERRFEEYGIYSTAEDGSKRIEKKLAYKCPHCGDIIGGLPDFNKENSMGKMPLAGRMSVKYDCTQCKRNMEDQVLMCSMQAQNEM